MEANCPKLTERILQLTLEIIYLLTGEDNIVARKTLGDKKSCFMVPLQSLLIPDRNNEQKILDVTKKIVGLLTGESGNVNNQIKEEIKEEEEDLEYLEGHSDLHKDVIMAKQLALTSPDGSSNENPPERNPRPLRPPQEDPIIPQHHQEEEDFEIKTEIKEEEEEIYIGKNQLSMMEAEMMVTITKEESSDSTEGEDIWDTSEGRLILSADYTKEDFEIVQYSPGVSILNQNVHPDLNDMARSSDGLNSKEQDSLPSLIPNVQSGDRPPDLCNPEESSSSSDLLIPKGIDNKPFSCPQCDKTFFKRSNLLQHQRVHTEGDNILDTSEEGRLILSEDFEIVQYSPSGSILNQNVHPDLNDMPRSSDGLNPKEQDSLPNFISNVQSAVKPPDLCNPAESSSSSQPFIPKGIDNKPVSCPLCEKTFYKRSNLNQHQRIHTGEKPFSCTECGKSFSCKGNRDKHMRIHTGEKPFSCNECGKCFAQKVTLYLHQRTHTA